MSDIQTATRSHYDRYSYDFETSLHDAMQLEDSLLGRALEAVKTSDLVVDAGCGTGLMCRLVRQHTPARGVIGVDLSLGSLRRNAARSSGVSLVQGDILRLPVRSDAVDLVISRGVIMTTGAPERAFAELARMQHDLVGTSSFVSTTGGMCIVGSTRPSAPSVGRWRRSRVGRPSWHLRSYRSSYWLPNLAFSPSPGGSPRSRRASVGISSRISFWYPITAFTFRRRYASGAGVSTVDASPIKQSHWVSRSSVSS